MTFEQKQKLEKKFTEWMENSTVLLHSIPRVIIDWLDSMGYLRDEPVVAPQIGMFGSFSHPGHPAGDDYCYDYCVEIQETWEHEDRFMTSLGARKKIMYKRRGNSVIWYPVFVPCAEPVPLTIPMNATFRGSYGGKK